MKKGFYFLCLGLLSLFTFNCGSQQQNSTKSIFKYNEAAGISTLDPAYSRYLEDMRAIDQIYDGLLELDDSLKIKPSIAHSYEISEDGLSYFFKLRTDVYFPPHESFKGKESRRVTAQDFVYSFNRILDPKVASPGMWIFNAVDKDNIPFQALNDSTFVIHLKETFPAFLGILTMQYCNAVPREVVEMYGSEFRNKPHGSGPFKLAFWLEGVSLVLHKNEHYHLTDASGIKLPYLDAVRIDFIRDKSAMFMDFLKGNYDFISGIDASYKDELLTPNGALAHAYEDKINFQRVPFIKTDYIGLLVDSSKINQSSLLADSRFRRALNYAVDRDKLVKYLRNNSVYAAKKGFLPKGFESHGLHGHKGFNYDLKKAKELLNSFTESQLDKPIVISTTSEYVDICEYLQHQWGQLGLKVSVEALQSSNHRDLVANSKLPVFRKSWLADYTDEENFLGLFYSKNFSPNGPNYTHFSNAQFDHLFEEALNTPNYSERKIIYGAMDSILLAESPVIPLFYDQVSHFLRKEIKNFRSSPVNMLDLRRVKK